MPYFVQDVLYQIHIFKVENCFAWSHEDLYIYIVCSCIVTINVCGCPLLCGTKLWREKTLADLVVHCQSAKVLSAKKLSGLVSSNIEWALPLPTAKVFSANILAVSAPPKFIPPKFCAIRYSL